MPEPIQQRRRQLLIAKHLHPFAQGESTRHDRGALAVSLRQAIQESLAPGTFARHKAECVQDQAIDLHQALLHTPSRPLIPGFHQGAHERRRPGTQDPVATPRRFDAEPHAERRLPRANRTDHHYIFAFLPRVTTGQCQHLRARHPLQGGPLEVVECLHLWEPGLLES